MRCLIETWRGSHRVVAHRPAQRPTFAGQDSPRPHHEGRISGSATSDTWVAPLVPSCRVSSITVFPLARYGSLVWVRPGTWCLYNWAPYLMQCRHEYWDRLNKMVIKIYSLYYHLFRIHLNFYYSSCTPLHAMQKSQSIMLNLYDATTSY